MRPKYGILAVFVAMTAAAEAQGPPLLEQPGDYTRYSVTLNDALGEDRELLLHFGVQDGEFRQAWATMPWARTGAQYVNTPTLRLSDGRLSGRVEVRLDLPN